MSMAVTMSPTRRWGRPCKEQSWPSLSATPSANISGSSGTQPSVWMGTRRPLAAHLPLVREWHSPLWSAGFFLMDLKEQRLFEAPGLPPTEMPLVSNAQWSSLNNILAVARLSAPRGLQRGALH